VPKETDGNNIQVNGHWAEDFLDTIKVHKNKEAFEKLKHSEA
jgi:hypothetical protein